MTTIYLLWRMSKSCMDACCDELFGIYSTEEKRDEVQRTAIAGEFSYWHPAEWELND